MCSLAAHQWHSRQFFNFASISATSKKHYASPALIMSRTKRPARTIPTSERGKQPMIQTASGVAQEFHDVAANQTLIINEPPLLSAPAKRPDGAFEFTLTSRNGLNYQVHNTTNLTE